MVWIIVGIVLIVVGAILTVQGVSEWRSRPAHIEESAHPNVSVRRRPMQSSLTHAPPSPNPK